MGYWREHLSEEEASPSSNAHFSSKHSIPPHNAGNGSTVLENLDLPIRSQPPTIMLGNVFLGAALALARGNATCTVLKDRADSGSNMIPYPPPCFDGIT